MRRRLTALAVLFAGSLCLAAAAPAAEKESRVFELRTYYAAPGKLEGLLARFRNHTVKLFEKHGMTNVGYWTPVENPDSRLIYLLAFPSREAAEKSWQGFRADPEWQRVRRESEADGALVAKIESLYLTPTDYSPQVGTGGAGRAFELRDYTAAPGRLEALNARFRDHTLKLFRKHGIENVGYWVPVENSGTRLVYLVAHRSQEAAKESYAAFGRDPEWQAARKASEEKAGGSLTAPGGVRSTFLKPTDFSPLR